MAETGVDAACAVLDVTDPTAVNKAADSIVAEQGKVDVLVNSAGIARLNSAIETPDDEWRAVMDVNINGLFWCCRAFGRYMVAQGIPADRIAAAGFADNQPLDPGDSEEAFRRNRRIELKLTDR